MSRQIYIAQLEVQKLWLYNGKVKSECLLCNILSHSETTSNNVLSKKGLYGTQKKIMAAKELSDKRPIFNLLDMPNRVFQILQKTGGTASYCIS